MISALKFSYNRMVKIHLVLLRVFNYKTLKKSLNTDKEMKSHNSYVSLQSCMCRYILKQFKIYLKLNCIIFKQ